MRTPLRRIAASVGVAGLLAGCGGGEAPGGAAVTIDTLPGGRVVVHNPDPAAPDAGVERWTLRERVRIGSLDGEGADVFGQVVAVELGADSSIYVLDGQVEEVRIFGPDGAFLRTLGRSGEGPGELSRPAGMALDMRGRLWVLNWSNARYTAYDPSTGEVVKEGRRPASFVEFPWPGGVDREGRIVDVGLADDGDVALLQVDSAFIARDTLRLPPESDEYRITMSQDERMMMSMSDPFAPRQAWAPHAFGGIVVGNGGDYAIHRVGFTGDTTLTMVVDRRAVAVPSTEADSALAAFEELLGAMEGIRPSRDPRVPPNKPAHGALHVDDDGRTWVQVTTDGGAAWDVLGPDGLLIATVDLPPGLTQGPSAVRGGRAAVGLRTGGFPTVVLYDIVPGGDGG